MNPTRRRFLELSAAATASALNQTSLLANVKSLADPKPLRIAILGLGNYAENWIAPAIAQARFAEVAGIITGSPEKIPQWQENYQIPDANVYNYATLDEIVDNENIDAVYVVSPTGTHRDFTIRALEAGKHVICEKPMAPTVADCTRMIEAAQKNDRLLQIGYRLYWEPHNVRLMTAMRDQEFGGWTEMETAFAYQMNPPQDDPKFWRISRDLSIAGALYDIGIYAVQGALYAAQEHPISVIATHQTMRPEIFTEVPEHWEWEFRWKGGRTSKHLASYGARGNHLNLTTRDGKIQLDRAFGYLGQTLSTPKGEEKYTHIFQQKRQIENQALAILKRQPNITSGEMGRRDIKIVNAIMESAETGKAVTF